MRPAPLVLLVSAALLAGCNQRRLSITSEPPGALVSVNDVEIGRTPVQADFTYYGNYDVLVTREGYEPLRTKAKAIAPIYERAPFDLATMAVPTGVEKTVRWHFVLTPAIESTQTREDLEAGIFSRARDLRSKIAR